MDGRLIPNRKGEKILDLLKLRYYLDILIMCLLVSHTYTVIISFVLEQEVRILSIFCFGICYYQVTRTNRVFPELKEKWTNDLKKK